MNRHLSELQKLINRNEKVRGEIMGKKNKNKTKGAKHNKPPIKQWNHKTKSSKPTYNNKAWKNKAVETTWDSGLKIISKPRITISHLIQVICDKIQDEFPNSEFSILCKGIATDEGYYVTDDYIIPKQKVSYSSVDYEDLHKYQQEGYNVVIHSHHKIGTFFSKTDKEHINVHFPCSVLYTSEGFTLATMSFHKGDSVFMLETRDIEILINDDIQVVGIENIEKAHVRNYRYTNKSKTSYNKRGTLLPKKTEGITKSATNMVNNAIETVAKKITGEDTDDDETIYGGPDCPSCAYRYKESCIRCYGDEFEYQQDVSLWDEENGVVYPCAKDGDCPYIDGETIFAYPCSDNPDYRCPIEPNYGEVIPQKTDSYQDSFRD